MTQFAEPLQNSYEAVPHSPRLVTRSITQLPKRKRRPSSADRAAASVRLENARACLVRLREAGGSLTVADLAGLTNLSKPTVDSVLQDLMTAGTVQESVPFEPCTPGRPARRFAFDATSILVAGVDVGSKAIVCSVADANGRVLGQSRRRFKPSRDGDRFNAVAAAVDDAAERARHKIRELRSVEDLDLAPEAEDPQLAAVGVSVPGVLDSEGRLIYSLATPDWLGLVLEPELSRRLDCPVHVQNDNKLAAYAEHRMAGDVQDLVYIQIGHRISVALVLNGVLLQGSHGLAGEVGSQRGMRWTKSSQRGELQWSTGSEAEELVRRAAAGDQKAIREIDSFCAEIAPRIAALLLVVDPEVVVVGGGLSMAGDLLIEPLQRHVDRQLMNPDKPAFRTALRPGDDTVIGALGHAFKESSQEIYGLPDVPPPWAHLAEPQPAEPVVPTAATA